MGKKIAFKVEVKGDEGEEISVIDPEKCTDCAACVEVCPVEAIIEA